MCVRTEYVLVQCSIRPLTRYGLPPTSVCVCGGGGCGEFCRPYFYKAKCLARILQHVSLLVMAALTCNSLLHTLPHTIFDNLHEL